jgi:subtilisin family serine protease
MKLRGIQTLFVIVIAAGTACSSTPPRNMPSNVTDPAGADQQIIVAIHQSRTSNVHMLGGQGKPYLRRSAYRASAANNRILEQIARDYEISRVDGWPIRSLEVYCEVYEITEGQTVDRLVQSLTADPRVELAQAMNIFETLTSRYDDPYLEMQSAVRQLEVEAAHHWATGKGITVAVIDSAVDTGHPELAGQIRLARDFVTSDSRSGRGDIHGTAVAGVIAALANNQEGIVGVAPEVRIEALRACWQSSPADAAARCSSFTLAKALEFVVENRPDILNLSLTGPPDNLLSRLLTIAVRRGIIVVTAYPSNSTSESPFPAALPGLIVARTMDQHRGNLQASVSLVEVVAPGDEILTTAPDAAYKFMSGSSIAAAHVSGVAALLLERDPELSAYELAGLMTGPGNSPDERMVNACHALTRLLVVDGCTTRLADL